ncbi:lytic murein transglycosylase [Alteromonas sp. 5E99-2]|uniref:lytic murein transglycosylase n=1 Tax=Alteromonas sp. 5E99-2 TaxID=2817683 RepID=UPI001A999A1E|nr:lytic murein transglycosylase [Alteromonas sp. 5E99-2]MBO1254667.1 lytic murein transglycosylase [Alteromonas sp. 5E99-2]
MRHYFSAIVVSFICFSVSAEQTEAELAFNTCKPELLSKATQAGVNEQLAAPVIDGLQYQARVIELDRKQPEFVQTFPSYFSKRVNDWRINKGKEMYAKHKSFLASLTHEYGVPAHYILSFWGLETNFGNYKGKMPVLDSLATLACDPRRSSYFTQEFVVALELMQRESLTTEQMVGSWAGAMGHTQFMPSAYKHYAIDGDGDNKIDLWNSEQDALASAAHFLANLGWTPGLRWGREVQLPKEFNYGLMGREHKQSITEWAKLGLKKADGSELGNADVEGYLVVPAGHTGPKFLVYKNFRTIMRWNNSEFYAIAVGNLADQLIGGSPLKATLPDLPVYTRQTIKSLQAYLNTQGFEVGKPDGIMGPMTRNGIRQAQQKLNLTADGFPSKDLMDVVTQTR